MAADALAGYGIPLPPVGSSVAPGWQPRSPGVIAASKVSRPVTDPQQKQQVRVQKAAADVINDALSPMQKISNSARWRKTVVLVYRKKTDFFRRRVVEVEPYSVRGPYLYAWCLQHNSIHSFLISNIVEVRQTDRKYVPRFPVEF